MSNQMGEAANKHTTNQIQKANNNMQASKRMEMLAFMNWLGKVWNEFQFVQEMVTKRLASKTTEI